MCDHLLQPSEPVKDDTGRTVFRAACACMPPGSFFYGSRLQHVYAQHHAHLGQVRRQSRANHPTSWAARRPGGQP